jgi:hypothetical protein
MDILEVIPLKEKKVFSAASNSVGQLWRNLVLLIVVLVSLQLVDLPNLDGIRCSQWRVEWWKRCGRKLRESEAAGHLPSLSSVNKRDMAIKPSTPDHYRASLQVAQANQASLADSLFRQSDVLYERI